MHNFSVYIFSELNFLVHINGYILISNFSAFAVQILHGGAEVPFLHPKHGNSHLPNLSSILGSCLITL